MEKLRTDGASDGDDAEDPVSPQAGGDGPRPPAGQDAGADAGADVEAEPAWRVSAPPASWRHAAEWVDLEFERAGLPNDESENLLESPWGSADFPAPDSGVLWPHAALHEHRTRPFGCPQGMESEPGQASKVAANRERLAALWKYSTSHGISWDELDEAYVTFARAGKLQYDSWSRQLSEGAPVQAAVTRRAARRKAREHYQPRCPEDEDGKRRLPEDVFPGQVNRLAAKLFRREKKRYLGPWRPGKLSMYLRELVAARVSRRESAERAHWPSERPRPS